MCSRIEDTYVISHKELFVAGIFINEKGLNVPLNDLNAVAAVRIFAAAFKDSAAVNAAISQCVREHGGDNLLGSK